MKILDKRLLAAAIAVVFILLVALRPTQPTAETEVVYTETEQMQQEMQEASAPPELVVHVAGAVKNPGVYTLTEGQRVEDAINLAGLCENADVDALNRAAVLSDGQKIVVPEVGESGPETQAESSLVDLNQADLQQLMTLPGIGQVKAQAILDYRAQYGNFQNIEEVQQVSGIGAATFAQIKNKIKI